MSKTKRGISLVLLVIMVWGLGLSGAMAASLTGTARDNAIVYGQPTGSDLDVLGEITGGTALANLRKLDASWYVFAYQGADAYIKADSVRLDAPSGGSGQGDSGLLLTEDASAVNAAGILQSAGQVTQQDDLLLPTDPVQSGAASGGNAAGAAGDGDKSTAGAADVASKAPDPTAPPLMARVSIADDDGYLPMYSEKDTNAEIVAQYAQDYEFIVGETKSDWTQVTDSQNAQNAGYIQTEYLAFRAQPGADWEGGLKGTLIPPAAAVQPTESTQDNPAGDILTAGNRQADPDAGTDGLPSATDPQDSGQADTEDDPPAQTMARVSIPDENGTLPLYRERSESAGAIAQYVQDYQFVVIDRQSDWTQVQDAYNESNTGFMPTEYLAFQMPDGNWEGGRKGTQADPPAVTDTITDPPAAETTQPPAAETTEPPEDAQDGTPAQDDGTPAQDGTLLPTGQKARVALADQAASLPLYGEKDANAAPIAQYAQSYAFDVIDRQTDWTQVKDPNNAALTGYMRTESLAFQQTDGSWQGGQQADLLLPQTAQMDTLPDDGSVMTMAAPPLYSGQTVQIAYLPTLGGTVPMYTDTAKNSVIAQYSTGATFTVGFNNNQWAEVTDTVNRRTGYMEKKYLQYWDQSLGWQDYASPPPSPTATPAPGTGQQLARVSLAVNNQTLPLYPAMSVGTPLKYVANNTVVEVVARHGDWTYVDTGEHFGYFQTAYLAFRDNSGNWIGGQGGSMPPGSYYAYINMNSTTATAQLYNAPSIYAGVVGRYYSGQRVIVLGWDTAGWTQVRVEADGRTGYIQTQYLTQTWPPINPPDYNTAVVNNPNPSDWLNLRSQPSYSGRVLGQYRNGKVVNIIQYDASWCYVYVDGLYGYMETRFLRFNGQNPSEPDYRYAVVNNLNPYDLLNLRAQPSRYSTSLGRYGNGTAVTVIRYGPEWCYVEVYGKVGYMITANLRFQGVPNPSPSPGSGSYAVVNNPGSNQRLNLRAAPTKNSASLGQYYNGKRVYIISYNAEWCHVQVDGRTGYMMTMYLSFSGITPSPNPTGVAIVNNPRASQWLNLRAQPSTSSRVLGQYYNGKVVTVLSYYDASWCSVVVDGINGYMMTRYLRFP